MRALLLLALACWASPARAEPLPFRMFTLANGLRVILAPDASAPTTAVSLIVPVGSRHESPGRSGFAHLFEHLMFTGTKRMKKGEADRIVESLGGDGSAETWLDYTIYYERMPPNALPAALWIHADRLGGMDVGRKALANQVDVVKEEKRLNVLDEPYGRLMWVEITSAAYANWDSRHDAYGSFEDLEAARLDDVRAFFDAHYAPANAALAVAGAFDPEAVRPLVESWFGGIPNRARVQRKELSEPPQAGPRVVRLEDEHAAAGGLAFAYSGMPERGSREYLALTLLGRYLFEGKSARLYQALVKENPLLSSIDTPWAGGLGFPASDWRSFKAPGLFGGFLLLNPGVDAASVRAALGREIDRLAEAGIAERDLERVKARFRSDWHLARQPALGRAQALALAWALDGDPASDDERLESFMTVTPEEIQKAAAAHLIEDRLNLFYLKAGAK